MLSNIIQTCFKSITRRSVAKPTRKVTIKRRGTRSIHPGTAHYVTGNKEDAVAIKSGEDEEGRARSIPSRDITVQHLTVHGGHAVSVGSEMSGGVYNVMFTDITFDGRNNGFGVGSARIKTQRGRGGVVDGVTFQNIHGEGKAGGEGNCR